MDTKKSIDVLNVFISINKNRFENYESATKQTDESDLIDLFSDFREKSQKCKAELISEVKKLGGEPIQKTKISLPFIGLWLLFKSKFTIKDREYILNRCEYDDDNTVKTYINIIQNNKNHLTTRHQNMLKAQHQSIKIDHDILKGLIDMMVNYRELNLDT